MKKFQKKSLPRVDQAPQSGYTVDGPESLGGPVSEKYTGLLPVYQWDINPRNSSLKAGEANVDLDDWEFRLWWQIHPASLVYASIQAFEEDWIEHSGQARPHPVGRSEVVNLVYDLERKAVVAIYGTARDFRPFVEAFRVGFGIKCSESGKSEEDHTAGVTQTKCTNPRKTKKEEQSK